MIKKYNFNCSGSSNSGSICSSINSISNSISSSINNIIQRYLQTRDKNVVIEKIKTLP